MSTEPEWTEVGHTEWGTAFLAPLGTELPIFAESDRIIVELNPDDVFAALCGTSTLTDGVPDNGGVRFDLSETERVWISWAALGSVGRRRWP